MSDNNTQGASPKASGTFFHDFAASIVVFLVALPLCMGIAVASGAPVWTGLVTGIVGGLVVGVLAGQPLQVSGPAAGLTVVVYGIIQEHGLEMLGVVVLIGGLLQLLAAMAGLGQWFRAVSPAVIKGMLAGIGVLIFASQFHVMLDHKPQGSGLHNLVTIPYALADAMVVPELGAPEDREFRAEKLRQLGELSRRQEVIQQRAVEVLPDRGDYEVWENLTAEQEERHASRLNALAPDQESLLEDLRAVTEDMKAGAGEIPDNGGERDIAGLADTAVNDAEAALQALRAGEGAVVLETQDHALQSIEAVMGGLKSHSLAGLVGLLAIGVIVLWQSFRPKKLELIPAPLIGIIVATGVTVALSLPVLYIEIPDNIFGEIALPSLESLRNADWTALLQSGVVVALIASVETLLCATAVDQMQDKARTRYNRELFSQGVGNSICGLVGALPMTGVIVRSSTNVMAGGQTRLSAILHGAWLLVFVSSLAFLLRSIPTAALAALLVYIGYRLVDRKAIRELIRHGWSEFAIYLATVVVIVVADLLTGVITGVVLSAVKLLYTFSHLHTKLDVDRDAGRAMLSLEGAAVFVRLPKLAAALEEVPPNTELHVDLEHLEYIDHACLDLLTNWAKQEESKGGKLVVDWGAMHAKFRRDGAMNNGNAPAPPKGVVSSSA